ncbi:unnamed protein product (macronuclear) [Paramecium tetraurelia]|uniref:Transmembrane protein n=1 Tax=Paramecium tetraurelia TaxID=5888 RepID=A0DWE1_PARTE|nr:uncharacterized protein GSPATT00021000001 [Paramecium tetraurelia]CAK87358.1 unnamed protein product [Paramecium tetraurelia]|eukprot:XP_001454755.1 hypothetical protein (macronuclear) [Paramecium tetraurelia strain d4-2]
MQQLKKEEGDQFVNKFVRTMLQINDQFYCYEPIKIFLFMLSMSQTIFYLQFQTYELCQNNFDEISQSKKILYIIRPELILLKYLNDEMLFATPYILVLLILIMKIVTCLNIHNQHLRYAKRWNKTTHLQMIIINIISFYQQLFHAVLHYPLQTLVICAISKALQHIQNQNSNYIASLVFCVIIFLLLEAESISLIFICRKSTTLQIFAFEQFLMSTFDFIIYALQISQIIIFGISGQNIVVIYAQQFLIICIAILKILNQLHYQGYIYQHQRYLLYIINSVILMYSLFQLIDLSNNAILIWPLFTSVVIYADRQFQYNSIYSLFLENSTNLKYYVHQLMKISNNCYQDEILPIQYTIIWIQHKLKCKDTTCLCKELIQKVLNPSQTNIITEPIFNSFVYTKINHIKKLIYSNQNKNKVDAAFYEIVQATLFMRSGFILMAIKNYNKILFQANDLHRRRVISQEKPLISQRRAKKSLIDSQLQEIINNQQKKGEKYEVQSKNYQISNLEIIKIKYRITQAQMNLNENFSSYVCNPQQHQMSDCIFYYLLNEFDLNTVIQKIINLIKMKTEFYCYLLNSENLKGNHVFNSISKFSKNVNCIEDILLKNYNKYASAKLRHLIIFFYSKIYNSYLKAIKFKQINNIQHEKLIYRNQTIDFYSDKIGYVLLQLQDDLQNLVIKQYSSNFLKIINKSNDENKLNFYDVLPDFIKDAHPILVQRFVQTGQARFYRSLSLTFIQQDNGLAKQMEQSFDTITLLSDNKIVFGAVIQDVLDQKAYLLVNVNGNLSGMTFMCLRKLGFTVEQISSVNNFYQFYELEINQIVPNFNRLIETDFEEQKFDNIRIIFLDLSSNNSLDVITKSTQQGNQLLSKVWQNSNLVKEYLVDLYIMKRNVFGFFYYIIEIESAYQIDYSQYNRNHKSLLQIRASNESAVFDIDSLILSLQDVNSELEPEYQEQEGTKKIKQVTKNAEFQGILQKEQINPDDTRKQNLNEQQPQLIKQVQNKNALQQQDFFCFGSPQSPLASQGQNSSNQIRSQNQNQLDAILDLNSESSLNSIKKPSFIKRLESIERFYSSFNSNQQKVLLFSLLLTLIVCFIFSIFILSLLQDDLMSKIQSIQMLSFQANILAPYDEYLGIRAQINYYQELYASNKINFIEQLDLLEPLYSVIDIDYNELRQNSYSSLLEKDLSGFFKDLYTDAFFMGTSDKTVYSKNITFREFIHQLLSYQYDYKNILDKRSSSKGCPCQVFQFSNYFILEQNLEQISQEILTFSKSNSDQIVNKWWSIWISFVIVCFLLCILIYYLRMVLALQCDTIMQIVTRIQEQSLKREIENQKNLILGIISDNDLINTYQLDDQVEKQQVDTKIENMQFRKPKRKELIRTSKLKSIVLSLILLFIYFVYSSIAIFSSQNFLNLYESTQELYKLIADLSFRSGNLFLYREMIIQWQNETYLNKSDGQKLYNLIDDAEKIILDYIDLAPRVSLDGLLISQEFLTLFEEVQNNDVCNYLDEQYEQVFGQYCLKSLEGSLMKGMLTTLPYIYQTIKNQQAINNFTFRAEDIFYEVEGGQIVSRVFSNIKQELQDGIIAKTEKFNFQNRIFSILFLLALFSICFYILFIYYNNIQQNLKMMKFSVFMIPQKDILQNDIFEKCLKQIEMKLGYKL